MHGPGSMYRMWWAEIMGHKGEITIEVVRQLRGECDARQVPGAKIGLSFAQGMSPHGLCSTLIMAAD